MNDKQSAALMTEQERSKALLRLLSVQPHRLRGQNFLVDDSVPQRIAETVPLGSDDQALEIGPGLGALTRQLAKRAGRLTAVEIEPEFAAYLRGQYAEQPQVEVVCADALSYDFTACYGGAPYRLFANVPYNITTPLLKRLLLNGGAWQSMTLLLQKEAAERIAAGRGRSNGPLTLLTEYYAESEICFIVPPHAFYPAPAVDSAVLLLQRRAEPPIANDIKELLPLIEAAFSERRKTLANALGASPYGGDKHFWQQGLAACGLDADRRAEQLSLTDFAALGRWLSAAV